MKYLMITTDYPPKKGGVARYSYALASYLGDDMQVIADVRPQPAGQKSTLKNCTYTPFMQDRWPYWMGAVRELMKYEAHVVLVQHVIPLGLAALIHKRRTGVPYMVFLHGMDFSLATRNPWKRFLTKHVLAGAHTVITNTRALADEVEAFADIEPIVSHPLPGVSSDISIQRQRGEGRTIELLSVARLVERKGIQRVLHVLARSATLQSTVHYTISGAEGDYRKQLKQTIAELGLEDIVTIHLNQTDEELADAYRQADLFVLPTLSIGEDREGFGIVYLEAAVFGLPSIASRISGVDEAIVHGETGILIASDEELADALEGLVTDHERRLQLGANAKERVGNAFRADKVYAPLMERLRSV